MTGDNVTDNWFVLKDILPVKKFLNLYEVIDPTKPNDWTLSNYSNSTDEKAFWAKNLFGHLLPFYDVGIYIKYKIKKKIKHNISLIRINVNGQTSNQNGSYHDDMSKKLYYSFIFFTNTKWNAEYGGNFNFYNPEEKEYHSVQYIPNTGVLIPSYWNHYGSAPFSNTYKLRTTVAFMYVISEEISKDKEFNNGNNFSYYGVNNEF